MTTKINFGNNLINRKPVIIDLDNIEYTNILNVGQSGSGKTMRNIDKIKQLKHKYKDNVYIIVVTDSNKYNKVKDQIDLLKSYDDCDYNIFDTTNEINTNINVSYIRKIKSFIIVDIDHSIWDEQLGYWIKSIIGTTRIRDCQIINTETDIEKVPFEIMAQSSIIEFGWYSNIYSYDDNLLNRYGIVNKNIKYDVKRLNTSEYILSVKEHRIPVAGRKIEL